MSASCRDTNNGTELLARFLHDRTARRASLEASLVDGARDYRAQRLAHYATDPAIDARSWERLPEYNPRVGVDDAPLAISNEARAGDQHALLELGRAAFMKYPAQRAPFAATDEQIAQLHLVRVHYDDDTHGIAMTCATCHSNAQGVIGAANTALDLGALILDAPLASRGFDRDRAQVLATWGPGRVDVTTNTGSEPAFIPDLRPVRYQRHLQHSGAVVQRDVTSLAVRIETLIITAHDEGVRPPREVALGLALYLWSLADALPALDRASDGAKQLASSCAKCHAGDAMSGALVDATKIGGDDTLARSRDRGTGSYRIPSLRGVGTRERLMHDGSVKSLDDLLDPSRIEEGRSIHRFGTELSVDDRAALIAFLKKS